METVLKSVDGNLFIYIHLLGKVTLASFKSFVSVLDYVRYEFIFYSSLNC